MIVVADAGPIQYLVRIGAIEVLGSLYQRVLVPQIVARELQHANTPTAVRSWVMQPPAWCEIRPDPLTVPRSPFSMPANGPRSRWPSPSAQTHC